MTRVTDVTHIPGVTHVTSVARVTSVAGATSVFRVAEVNGMTGVTHVPGVFHVPHLLVTHVPSVTVCGAALTGDWQDELRDAVGSHGRCPFDQLQFGTRDVV